MINYDEKQILELTDTTLTFNEIYLKPYFPERYEEDIKRANVLLIPQYFRDYDHVVFPEQTSRFFEYIKEKSIGTGIIPEICISDEEYRELQLHDSTINLPELIAQLIFFPILTSIIAAYFYEKIKERGHKDEPLKATINITVESDGKSKRIHYEGNADKFDDVMKTVNKRLKKIL